MPITRKRAEGMSTAGERELILQSYSPDITKLSRADVRSRVTRSRRLRDKYRAQADSRRRKASGKAGTQAYRGRADALSFSQKSRLLGEVLERYTKRLQKLDTAPPAKFLKKAVARKKAAQAAADLPASQTARSGNQAKAPAPRGKIKAQRYKDAGTTRVQAHLSSRNKRTQAKHDSR